MAEFAWGFEQKTAKIHVDPIGDQWAAAIGMIRRSAADVMSRGGRGSYTGSISRIVKQLAPPVESAMSRSPPS